MKKAKPETAFGEREIYGQAVADYLGLPLADVKAIARNGDSCIRIEGEMLVSTRNNLDAWKFASKFAGIA